MTEIGTFEGLNGLEQLRREVETLLRHSPKVVVAIAGLPGCGKTVFVKDIARLGFGHLRKREVIVIDDNTLYTASFWRLAWKKILLPKEAWRNYLNTLEGKVVFFSNWIPSRFLDSADILLTLAVDEEERLARLRKRERKHPAKIAIQMNKTTLPVEEPFSVGRSMTLIHSSRLSFLWSLFWLVRRRFSR